MDLFAAASTLTQSADIQNIFIGKFAVCMSRVLTLGTPLKIINAVVLSVCVLVMHDEF